MTSSETQVAGDPDRAGPPAAAGAASRPVISPAGHSLDVAQAFPTPEDYAARPSPSLPASIARLKARR